MHTYSSSNTGSLVGRTLQFRAGASLMRHSQALWLALFTVGIPLALATGVLFLTSTPHAQHLQYHDIWQKLLLKMDKDPRMKWHLLLFVVLLPIAVVSIWAQRLAYLRLSAHGIEGYVPRWLGQGMRGLTTGRWQVLWESIRSARIEPGKRVGQLAQELAGYRLVLETDRGQIRLSPFFWIRRDGPDHRLTFRQMLNAKKTQAADLVMHAPLIQLLRERGISIAEGGSAASQAAGPVGFDLAKHRGLLIELALFFGAGLYALIDGLFIIAFKPLETLPLMPFLVIAVVALVMVSILGRGAPVVERSAVGILTVAALTAAVYPGLLRVNAISAAPQSVTYKAVAAGRFEPIDRELPTIDLTGLNVDEYWAQYPPGTKHEFHLLRGAGGFYQLDLRPFYAQTRDFYKRHS